MEEALFAEFEPATREEWVDAVIASLRGRSLESLAKNTYEGIDIHPLPHSADLAGISHHHALPGQFPFARGTRAAGYRSDPWLIAQDLDLSDPQEFNQALKEALANGQTAIVVSGGLRLNDADDCRLAFAGIDLTRFPLFMRSEARAAEIYDLLGAALSKDRMEQLRGCIGCDPLGRLARRGGMPANAFESMARHVQTVNTGSPQLGSIAISTAPYHDAGANAVQELAVAIATGVMYMRELNARGLPLDSVASKLHFFLVIGENFFMEIAKFRAIKLLWAQVLRAFDISSEARKIRVHARSGVRNKSCLDAHVNMLRLTTEALSAAIGGVDSIQLLPFDQPLGSADEFSRRLARNLQLILQEELRLVELIDPAGGAWHVETLTDQLARGAWTLFQKIETRGGLLASLESGFIQAEIKAIAEARRRDLQRREAILVGANMYANLSEALSARPSYSLEDTQSTGAGDLIAVEPLKPLRLAEPFEALQQQSGKVS